MHEMGIAIQIMDLVGRSLPRGEPLRVKAIHLRVGKLAAIVPKSLRLCMEVVTKDTPADGAELVFTEVPVVIECDECGAESTIERLPFVCSSCGSDKADIISGREMIVESIEVEDLEVGAAQSSG